VRTIHTTRTGTPSAFSADDTAAHESGPRFTPGDFLKEAGTLIAVCLGLGVLMRVLFG
jgi:hypothetical protein